MRKYRNLALAFCMLGVLFMGCASKNEEEYRILDLSLNSESLIREKAAVLEELGISVPEEVIVSVKENWDSMPEEVLESLDITATLLTAVGCGSYDFENLQWAPSSEQVYSFDVEVFDIGNMYTNFLKGVSAINGNEFEITQVEEDVSEVDFERGTGTHKISFCYNKTSYVFEGKSDGDWFDVGILDYMNEVLEREHNPKRLFFMGDGYQECIVFYATEEWVDRFAEKTGCQLDDTVQ